MAFGKKGLLKFFIDGKEVNAPIEWEDINILATFENDNVQANISTTEFTIVNEAKQKIVDYVESGVNGGVGIFEGLPVIVQVYNKDNTYNSFIGYIDLTDDYREELYNGKVFVKIKKKDGLNSISDRLSGTTFQYLYDNNYITDSDYIELEYVVEKNDNALELIVNSITLFLMIKELSEATKSTSEAIVDTAAFFATGLTGGIAAAIKTVGQAVILITYNAIILAAVIELTRNLINALISPVRKHKIVSLYNLFNSLANYLGYTLKTDIDDLDNIYFMASNINVDEFDNEGFLKKAKSIENAIPNIYDDGYICSNMLSNLIKMFNAKIAIVGETLQFRNEGSDYWIKQSTYKIPDVLEKPRKYNTDELFANRLISFSTDLTDIWTIDNFKGTNYEIITEPIKINNSDANYIKGLESIDIPYALGNRKDKLNGLEKALSALAGTVDSLTGIFGGGTNFKKQITNRVGMLKVSNNNNNIAKLLYVQGSKIPSNHRDLFSAKNIYEKYYYTKSFVLNNYAGQYVRFEGVRIPFGFSDFLKVIENNYIYGKDGSIGQVEKIDYNISSDVAIVDFRIKKVYTNNLKEVYIEP